MTQANSLDPNILSQFTGSEHWYRHGLARNVLFTGGAKYIADAAGAYWLLDEIALARRFNEKVSAEEFQVWQLKVNPDRTATLTCEDGNGNAVFTKAIEATDFPPEGHSLVRQQHDLSAERTLTAKESRFRAVLSSLLQPKPRKGHDTAPAH